MRYFSGLIFFAIMAYLGWPYFHLYQLNDAVANNDKAALEKLIDFEAVQEVYQEDLKWRTEQMASSTRLLPDTIREGAEAIVGSLGNLASKTVTIDTDWVLNQLRNRDGSLWEQLSFAFFESHTRFTIRLGKLGRNPVHIQMTLQDWNWRVGAIYD